MYKDSTNLRRPMEAHIALAIAIAVVLAAVCMSARPASAAPARSAKHGVAVRSTHTQQRPWMKNRPPVKKASARPRQAVPVGRRPPVRT
jgi:hypothetical protein